MIGSSDPKSYVEDIEAKTGARAKEEDITEDDKTADETATAEETAAEEIRKATERRCLRRERR